MNYNNEPDKWTLLKMVKWCTDFFQKKGIDSPRLTIELLLCKLLNIQRIDIYTNFEKPLLPEELRELKSMIKRRVSREPLQYILGKVNFCGLEIIVNEDVLIPRPETEFLVETIKLQFKKEVSFDMLDIGTGSGCISIALAKHFRNANIASVDVSEKALSIASKNAEKAEVQNIKFNKFDVLSEHIDTKYDLIVSNPPYISKDEHSQLQPEITQYEPTYALTDGGDGLAFYKRYAEIFDDIIKPNGKMFLEIGYGQKKDIEDIFMNKGLKIDFLNDSLSIPRIAIVEGL
jgi:release factor glutamine methyltransferase